MKAKNEAVKNQANFKQLLKEIAEILEWFDSQEELDIEQALDKMKRAADLIAISKGRLKEIENEFREIKKGADAATE